MIAIQARSGTTRWPGKIYHKINGVSMLERLYLIARSTGLKVVVIGHKSDKRLSRYCAIREIPCLLCDTPENDLVGRYAAAARFFDERVVTRVTADCAFHFRSEILQSHYEACRGPYDFVSNAFPPRSTIDGVDCESISRSLLEWMDTNVDDPHDREHLPLYVYRNKAKLKKLGFHLLRLDWPVNLSHIKTSIDTREDLENLRKQGMVK